jgi:hypothetical protein
MQAGNLIRIAAAEPDVVELCCPGANENTLDSRLNWFQKRELRGAIGATLESLDTLFGQVA